MRNAVFRSGKDPEVKHNRRVINEPSSSNLANFEMGLEMNTCDKDVRFDGSMWAIKVAWCL